MKWHANIVIILLIKKTNQLTVGEAFESTGHDTTKGKSEETISYFPLIMISRKISK
jgi:hypothetical protein